MKCNYCDGIAVFCLMIGGMNSVAHSAPVNVDGTIKSFDVRSGGYIQIFLNEPVNFDQSCTVNERVAVDHNDVAVSNMLAAAMYAKAVGKPVNIRVDGCLAVGDAPYNNTAPRVIRLSVMP